MKGTQRSAGRTGGEPEEFSEEERAAMKDRVRELKAAGRRAKRANEADGEAEVLAEMPAPERALGEQLHALIKASAPGLSPRLWYGMPAYYMDGSVICFFQGAYKFKARYATLGFSDKAKLDEGAMWPTYYALTTLTAEVEARIAALVRQAAR